MKGLERIIELRNEKLNSLENINNKNNDIIIQVSNNFDNLEKDSSNKDIIIKEYVEKINKIKYDLTIINEENNE